MSDAKMANRLELRWLPVVDERGRTRMEAQWIDVTRPVEPRVTHAA
jgi:hypothetical protein